MELSKNQSNSQENPHISNNDLLTVMNTHFEEMMNRMLANETKLKESLTKSLKGEIKKQVSARTNEVQCIVAKVMSGEVQSIKQSTKQGL